MKEEENNNIGKGIFHQMRESKVTYSGNLSLKDIKHFLEVEEKLIIEYRKELIKKQKENNKYLMQKSKELNKEVPFELQCMLDPYLNKSQLLSAEFMKKYKEWF